jgi:hypothetical protein
LGQLSANLLKWLDERLVNLAPTALPKYSALTMRAVTPKLIGAAPASCGNRIAVNWLVSIKAWQAARRWSLNVKQLLRNYIMRSKLTAAHPNRHGCCGMKAQLKPSFDCLSTFPARRRLPDRWRCFDECLACLLTNDLVFAGTSTAVIY